MVFSQITLLVVILRTDFEVFEHDPCLVNQNSIPSQYASALTNIF